MSDSEGRIRYLLEAFDKDGDGYLNYEEFATSRKVLAGEGGGSYSRAEYEADCMELFDEIPTNGIGLKELHIIYDDEEDGLQEDYDTAKKYFATRVAAAAANSSSCSSVSASSVSSTKSNIMVERIFKHFDKDKDGRWSFEEAKKSTQILSNGTRQLSREEFEATCEETYADPEDGLEEEHILCTYLDDPTRLRKDYRTVIRESCREKTGEEESKPVFGFTTSEVKPFSDRSSSSKSEKPSFFSPPEISSAIPAPFSRNSSSSSKSSSKSNQPINLFGEQQPKINIVSPEQATKKEDDNPVTFFASTEVEISSQNVIPSRKSSSSSSHKKEEQHPTQMVAFEGGVPGITISRNSSSSDSKKDIPPSITFGTIAPAISRKSSSSSSSSKSNKPASFQFGSSVQQIDSSVLPKSSSDSSKRSQPSRKSSGQKIDFFGSGDKLGANPPSFSFGAGEGSSSSASSSSSTRSNIMVERIFSQFDADKDGFWSFEETRIAKKQLSGEVMTMDNFIELCETTFAEPDSGLAEEQLRAIYAEEGSVQLKSDYKKAIKISCGGGGSRVAVNSTSASAKVETSISVPQQNISYSTTQSAHSEKREPQQSVPPPQLDTPKPAGLPDTSWRERRESILNTRLGEEGNHQSAASNPPNNNISNNEPASRTSAEAAVITIDTPVKMTGLPHPQPPSTPQSLSKKTSNSTSSSSIQKPAPPKLEHPNTPSVNSEYDVDEAVVWQSRSRAATNFTRLPLKTDSVKTAYIKKMQHCYVKEDISLLQTRLRGTQEEKALLELLIVRHADLGAQLKAALHCRLQEERDRLHLGRQREERLGCYSNRIFNAPAAPLFGAPHQESPAHGNMMSSNNITDIINFIEDRCSADLHLFEAEELQDAITHQTKEHTTLNEILATVDDLMMLIKTTLDYRVRQKAEHLQYRERAADRLYKRQLLELTKTEKYLETTSVGQFRF